MEIDIHQKATNVHKIKATNKQSNTSRISPPNKE